MTALSAAQVWKTPLPTAIKHLPVDLVLIFSGILLLVILILARILITRAKGERTINKLLYYDALTGLFNQRGFEKKARQILDTAPKGRRYALCHFDINSFELYNSLYGFEAGDRLLRSIANLISVNEAGSEPCARFANDNFVKLAQIRDLDEMLERVHRINKEIRNAVEQRSVLLSFGVYEIIDRELSISAMCDMAASAKRTVKGNYERFIGVYDEELRRRQLEDTKLVAAMDHALHNGEFVAYYQPKYEIRTSRIAGAEALVRWIRPDGEMISPARFVGLFEKNGLIARLDRLMFRLACGQLAALRQQGIEPVPISVNFSRVHLFDPNFADRLNEICEEFGVPPRLLEIELTESAFIVGPDILTRVIDRLRTGGFSVSMDDFGSGFSSLNMLKDMYFDVVKLDGGFLSETSETARGQKVIEGTLFLARRLKLKTVAEGVETAEQLALLRAHGCDLVQGYYFSRPVPAGEFVQMLRQRPSLPGGHGGEGASSTEEELGILEMRGIISAAVKLYPWVLSVNLTQGRCQLLEARGLLLCQETTEKSFSGLLEEEADRLHPGDRSVFLKTFSREAQLSAHARGKGPISLQVRRRVEDGEYRPCEINVVFVEDPKGQDVLALTFARLAGSCPA